MGPRSAEWCTAGSWPVPTEKCSWEFFEDALRSDLDDTQGGTTSEGIHLGAMAGTVDLVQRCYLGIETRNDVIWFDPSSPQRFGASPSTSATAGGG